VATQENYVGQSVPRAGAKKLLEGRGTYLDDLRLPRLVHVVFFRSPHAHANIKQLDLSQARKQPGVVAVFDGHEVAKFCTPWVGVLGHLKGIRSAPQYAIAPERACSQGEAVAAIVAQTRRQAEDALDHVLVEWDLLPVVTDMEASLAGDVVIHADLGDNKCFSRELITENFEAEFAKADVVVEKVYEFSRHTGVTNEPRGILADYNPAENLLTVYQGTQTPNMMQDIFSRHLGIPESNVRVICKDVGGSFGIKVHVYPDEMATAAISVMLKRPVKFSADRIESFLTDIHAREHKVKIKLACTHQGDIIAFDLNDLTGIGPYSVYPRTSGIEGNQVVNLTGGPYKHKHYKAKLDVVFTNKNVTCQYRAVGHPIAMAVTEGIVDEAARKIGMDPAEFRRRNLIADDAYPYTFPSGVKFEKLSHHQCLDQLMTLMDYKGLRQEQANLRAKGIYRGIGLAAMIEVTNPCLLWCGRCTHLCTRWRHHSTRPCRHGQCAGQCHRARSRHRGRVYANCSHSSGCQSRKRPCNHRRHSHYALWRWHVGIKGRRHWRRSGTASGQGFAQTHFGCGCRHLEGRICHPGFGQRRGGGQTQWARANAIE
jgi:carbon-monoxide dehydrogenase large subunit